MALATEKSIVTAMDAAGHDDDFDLNHNIDVEKQRRDDSATLSDKTETPSHLISGADGVTEPKDLNLVDWDGPDDPANPLNWPVRKKVAALSLVSLMTLLSPLASTIISPATSSILTTFHSTNITLGAFITSVYLLGYVFGPLVIAPLSELYGRAILYTACNTLFVIFNVACALAGNIGALIAFRFFAGVAASAPITLGPGSIADMVVLEKRGLAMASWILGPLLGPTFAPIIGSYLAEAKGWRWIFWLVTIVGGVVWLASIFLIHESYAFVLLQRKTERLQKETGNMQLRSILDTGKDPKQLFMTSIIRPIKMLFLYPIVLLLSLYGAVVYGYLYLMFTTFPRVFQGQYGFSDKTVGFTYLGIGIGSFIGLSICGAVSDKILIRLKERNGGVAKPEFRLPVMFVGAFAVPVGLFLYGWAAEARVHWIVPIIGTAFVGAGLFFIFMPSSTYLVDAYTTYAASVSAASTVFRSLLGALLPLAGNSMYSALGIGWGTSLLGLIAVAFIPVPLIFWKYGQRIRESRWSQAKL